MTLKLTPQNPILKVNAPFRQTFVATLDGGSPPLKWNWSLRDSAGTIIGTEESSESGSMMRVEAPLFIAQGKYKLSVMAEVENSQGVFAETTIVVVPEDFDEKNSFISYGVDGHYYLVALRRVDEDEGRVVRLDGIPDGFTTDDVDYSAPLARCEPQTIGAAFITCVMVNLKSKDNRQHRLPSEKAIEGKLGSSSTGGKK